MTIRDVHPMLRTKRPVVITRPTERLAGDGKNTIEIGVWALVILTLYSSGSDPALLKVLTRSFQ